MGSCQWEMQWHTKSTNTMCMNETYPCDISRHIVAIKHNVIQNVSHRFSSFMDFSYETPSLNL